MAKWQERGKSSKTEQKKFWGLEWGAQVKQTALLASPVYIGQAQREEKKHIKWGANIGQGGGLSSCLLGRHALTPRGCIFLYFLNKTERRAVTLVCLRAVTLVHLPVQIFVAMRQNWGNYKSATGNSSWVSNSEKKDHKRQNQSCMFLCHLKFFPIDLTVCLPFQLEPIHFLPKWSLIVTNFFFKRCILW